MSAGYLQVLMWTGRYWFKNITTMVSADLSSVGKASSHLLRWLMDMLVAQSGCFTFCDQVNGYFVKCSFQYLCHLQGVKLNICFFSAVYCTVSYIFPDVLIHAFPVVLMFYEAVCMSCFLVTKFVMCFHKDGVFPWFGMTRSKNIWFESITCL